MERKTVLITGGSKGIGRELALIFARNGFHVITCGRDYNALQTLVTQVEQEGGKIMAEVCDVQRPDDIHEFMKKIIPVVKQINVLVNNAGIFLPGQIHTEEAGVFEKTMRTNLDATYYFCRHTIPVMPVNSGSHIFNICSTASIIPYINGGSYCISKYAQYGLTKVLREELKAKRIGVTAVLPGATYTDSWSDSDLPPARFIKPETMAKAIWNAYEISGDAIVEDLLIRPMEGDIT